MLTALAMRYNHVDPIGTAQASHHEPIRMAPKPSAVSIMDFRHTNAFGESLRLQIFATHAVVNAGYRRAEFVRLIPGGLDGKLYEKSDRFGFYKQAGCVVFASGGAEWNGVDIAYHAFEQAAVDYFSHIDDY